VAIPDETLNLTWYKTEVKRLEDIVYHYRFGVEEIEKYCCEMYEAWKETKFNADTDNLKQSVACARMVAYADIGNKLAALSEEGEPNA